MYIIILFINTIGLTTRNLFVPPYHRKYVLLLLLHSFNSLFSRTTWVSQHEKSRIILVKPIWISWSKRLIVSGSGISWAISKSTPRLRQITMPAPHHSVFTGRMPFLPPNQQHQSTEGKPQKIIRSVTHLENQLLLVYVGMLSLTPSTCSPTNFLRRQDCLHLLSDAAISVAGALRVVAWSLAML